ncbi:MAG: HlyD family type I secretion periplasmic adaptor subunit [Rhizobiales bacterium]|nr:HlyD family type I secretion periplasmic adaptor subunit [Hyphomicrobiales bacterium]
MLRIAAGVIVFTFVVLGGWSALARIDSAVVAEGVVAIESNRKTIQHLEGGIVREILVRDGDVVQQGDVLVRLDPTRNAAADVGFRQQLAIASALQARLIAQREMAETVNFPPDVMILKDDPLIANAIHDNQSQFDNRRQSLLRGKEVFEQQIAQTKDEIRQAVLDEKTARQQIDSIGQELPNLKMLLEKGLVALPRVTTLERQLIQVQGQFEGAQISRTKATEKVGELQARIDQLKQDYRQEAANTLPDVRKTISDARQQLVVASDALRRIEIKAPVSGTVQQLKMFTIGGVIRPGDPILDIVPSSDTLVVRSRVLPIDVDRILPGQSVELRVPQFMKFELKPLVGTLRSISRDSIVDTPGPSGQPQPYFAVEIAVDRNTIPEDLRDRMTAGMTVDTIIRTRERTVLSYLVAPLSNRLAKSMRER